MNRRHNGGDPDGQDIVNGQLKQLFVDDEFLTALSRGVDPSEGDNALAGLLLDMNKAVRADMPAAPDLSVLLPVLGDRSEDADPGTTEFSPIADSEINNDTNGTDAGTVVALSSRRRRSDRSTSALSAGGAGSRRAHPFLNGLVGAAAATLVIAGGGTAIYNADADSPLYGISTTLFGNSDTPSVVELASTLEEVDSRTANGDVAGARELLEQARAMLTEMDERQRSTSREATTPAPVSTTSTVTATVTQTEAPERATPVTLTETATQTQTQTQTVVSTVVQQPIWTPEPTQTFQPPASPTATPENSGNTGGAGGEIAPPQLLGN